MDHPAHRLKAPPWDRLPPAEQAPYLREAREYVQADVYRDGQPDVAPEEFEDAVRQSAAEMYAEACQRKAAMSEQAMDFPRAASPRDSGQRMSL
jgi:RNase P/RNase MRP subunit POP5